MAQKPESSRPWSAVVRRALKHLPTADGRHRWPALCWSLSLLVLPFSWIWASVFCVPPLLTVPSSRIRRDPVAALLLVALGLISISQVLVNGPLVGVLSLLSLAPPTLFLIVVRVLMAAPAWRHLTTALLLFTLLPLGTLGLAQMLLHWDFLVYLPPSLPISIGHRVLLQDRGWPPGRMNSVLDHANALAFYLALVWPLLLYRLLTLPEQWSRNRWGLTALGMLTLTCLAATGSRNGLLVTLLTTGLVLLERRHQLGKANAISLSLLLLTGILAYGLPVLLPASSESGNLFRRFSSEFSGDIEPGHNRLHVWQLAVQMVAARPWGGYGPLAFTQRFYDLYGVALGHPHNLALTLAISQGIPATLLLLTCLIWTLLRSLRQRCRSLSQSLQDPYVISSLGLLGLSLVDLPFYKWQVSFLAMLILAIATRQPNDPDQRVHRQPGTQALKSPTHDSGG